MDGGANTQIVQNKQVQLTLDNSKDLYRIQKNFGHWGKYFDFFNSLPTTNFKTGPNRKRFFHGSVLGQDTLEPSLVLVKPRKA